MLDRLEMFIALAQTRHFGRAAESMGVTQPSLSAAIKTLEGELGVQLVWRGSRFEGLTPEGARVLDWAIRIVGDARTLREEMRAARHGLSGNLRLGVVPTALPMIARLTAPYLRANPNVRLEILSRSSIEILQQIDRLQLDAGVSYLDNEPLGRVVTVPLYTERYLLLTRPDHPMATRSQLTWSDLAGLPLCLLTPDMQNRRIINAELTRAGIGGTPQLESNSILTLIAHVQAGPWVSVVNAHTAELFANTPDLNAVPLSGEGEAKQVGLIA
ncbi:MAG: LysR family transcriptional regulator, partial [Rhodobacteraceae bacterium]|nr:LysR family transcriptional regulator [Paracoccaceae bacterium]